MLLAPMTSFLGFVFNTIGNIALSPIEAIIWAVLNLANSIVQAIGVVQLPALLFGYGPIGAVQFWGIFGVGKLGGGVNTAVFIIFQWAMWVGLGFGFIWMMIEFVRLGVEFATSGSNPQVRVSLTDTLNHLIWVVIGMIGYSFIVVSLLSLDTNVARMFGKIVGISQSSARENALAVNQAVINGSAAQSVGGPFAADIISVVTMFYMASFTIWYYFRMFAIILMTALGPSVGIVAALRPAGREMVRTFWREYLLLIFTQDIQAAAFMLVMLIENMLLGSKSGMSVSSAMVVVAGIMAIWPITNLIRTLFGAHPDHGMSTAMLGGGFITAAAMGLASAATGGGSRALRGVRGSGVGGSGSGVLSGLSAAVQAPVSKGAQTMQSAMASASRGRVDQTLGARVRDSAGGAAGSVLGAVFGVGSALVGHGYEKGHEIGHTLGMYTVGTAAGGTAALLHHMQASKGAENVLRKSQDGNISSLFAKTDAAKEKMFSPGASLSDRRAALSEWRDARRQIGDHKAAHMAGFNYADVINKHAPSHEKSGQVLAHARGVARHHLANQIVGGLLGEGAGHTAGMVFTSGRAPNLAAHGSAIRPEVMASFANLEHGAQVLLTSNEKGTMIGMAPAHQLGHFQTVSMSSAHLEGVPAGTEVSSLYEAYKIPVEGSAAWTSLSDDDQRLFRSIIGNRNTLHSDMDPEGNRVYLHMVKNASNVSDLGPENVASASLLAQELYRHAYRTSA